MATVVRRTTAEGNLIGGEWVGSSKTDHPDFVWLPTTISTSARVASGKISWGEVKTIYEMSIDSTEPVAATSTWNGNGSIISLTSGTDTGYGLSQTLADCILAALTRRYFSNGKSIRETDVDWKSLAVATRRLPTALGVTDRATESTRMSHFPSCLTRAKMARMSMTVNIMSCRFNTTAIPTEKTDVNVKATNAAASDYSSGAEAGAISVDGHTWNGNASIISHSSGAKTGYGLNYDVANIHPTSEQSPVVFFQWEVSAADGTTLEISAEGMESATISYGSWAERNNDITKIVTLPYTLNPQADGKSVDDGTWYVIKVAFSENPSEKTAVFAKTPNANLR